MENTEIATVETAVVETAEVEMEGTEMENTEMENTEVVSAETEVVVDNTEANKKVKFNNQCRAVLAGLEMIRFAETRNHLPTEDAVDFVAEIFAGKDDAPKASLLEELHATKEAAKAARKASKASSKKTRGKPLSPEIKEVMLESNMFSKYIEACAANNAPLRAALVATARATLNLRKVASGAAE